MRYPGFSLVESADIGQAFSCNGTILQKSQRHFQIGPFEQVTVCYLHYVLAAKIATIALRSLGDDTRGYSFRDASAAPPHRHFDQPIIELNEDQQQNCGRIREPNCESVRKNGSSRLKAVPNFTGEEVRRNMD